MPQMPLTPGSKRKIAQVSPEIQEGVVVVVNHCFTSLFGTKGLLSDIIIR